MDKDYVAVSFSGKDLPEAVVKMINFLNAIKGINLQNVQEQPAEEPKEKADDGRSTAKGT